MIQYERTLVRRPCVKYLREEIAHNQLKRWPFLYWTSPPDLGRKKPYEAALLKLDGYEKGNFDMTIIVGDESITKAFLIEFKYGKNGYTDEQKAIADKTKGTLIQALKIYSLDEFIAFVDKELR